MEQKIKPIIKWTGGKYREFALFKKHIPSFERYIEPFFGGGGVFFALQPKTPVVINDKSNDLIRFYRQINNPEFKERLFQYADAWEETNELYEKLWHECAEQFTSFVKETNSLLKECLDRELPEMMKKYQNLVNPVFVIEPALFQSYVKDSLLDKANRIQQICKREDRVFGHKELKAHFETGIKSGMYLFFRMLMNKNVNTPIFSEASTVANWYFVRELCYASMFRYNAKGKFNIPYGGIAYNRKKFRKKANLIFAQPTQDLFAKTDIYNEDFEKTLLEIALKPTDFIFLDPPYDSEFSEYDQNSFTQKDQKRLADFLINCPAKWMVVIKETPFVREIYTHPKVKIVTFGKKYTYNMRGRNDRKVTHLIITNY